MLYAKPHALKRILLGGIGLLGLFFLLFSSQVAAADSCFDIEGGDSGHLIFHENQFMSLSEFQDKNDGPGIRDQAACTCFPGYKKLRKTVYTMERSPAGTKKVTVCEKCSLETCNCGIKLNTSIPFIGKCIMLDDKNVSQSGSGTVVTGTTAFPILMGAIMRLLIGAILIVGLGMVIAGGFLMTTGSQERYNQGKKLIFNVVYTIVGLGLLGVILYLINPNFFV